jgi:PAS domain S-box-containing protein
VAVGAIYYAAARFCLLLQLPGTNASAVWAPSGIGIAAVLLGGSRVWPGIAAGAFLANLLTLPHTVAGCVAAGVIAFGNTCEQLIALVVIRRACSAVDPFTRAKDAVWFVAAAVISSLLAAISGTTALRLLGLLGPDLYQAAWATWWVGDATGMVVLGPALYAWYRRPRLALNRPQRLELTVLVLTTAITGELIFGGHVSSQLAATRPFLPLLLWAAFRFSQRETSSLATLISAQAVLHTWDALRWPTTSPATKVVMSMLFVNLTNSPDDWLWALQLFLCVTGVLAIIVAAAIAERDASKQALQDSEEAFRTIFEQAAVGVALIETASGRFRRINRRYCDLVGYTAGEMLATTLQAITHPEDRQADLDNMERLHAGSTSPFNLEKRYCRKDGTTVWVNLTVSPTSNPGAAPTHHIAIVEDITTRKSAERERSALESALREVNQSLELRIRERTRELEAANLQLEVLLREIHHRVKNNLAVISSLLYLESVGSGDGHTQRVLQDSQNRVRSMAMVHDELYRSADLSAIDARHYVDSLVNDLLVAYAASSRISLRTKIEPVPLNTDIAVPFGLIVTELVTNTLKHAFPHEGAGTISIAFHARADGSYVLTVDDDGVGVVMSQGPEAIGTMGLRLVRALARQLDAQFEIVNVAPGTRAILQVPNARAVSRGHRAAPLAAGRNTSWEADCDHAATV